MPHLSWFFMIGDDLDEFGLAIEGRSGPLTYETTHQEVTVWPSLRSAAADGGPVLIRRDGVGPGLWFVPSKTIEESTLRGGHVAHAYSRHEVEDDMPFAMLLAATRKALVETTKPWVRSLDGKPVRRYRIGRSAVAWVRAKNGRILRDESLPHLDYRVDPKR